MLENPATTEDQNLIFAHFNLSQMVKNGMRKSENYISGDQVVHKGTSPQFHLSAKECGNTSHIWGWNSVSIKIQISSQTRCNSTFSSKYGYLSLRFFFSDDILFTH